jgi:nucleoside-diphosphate-sugar epimerase
MLSQGKVLVTGATGFIGSALLRRLDSTDFVTRPVARKAISGRDIFLVKNIDESTDWAEGLQECSTVIHLAARVHVMHEKATAILAEFRRVNVEGTLALAQQAAIAGVQRFIFLSSIKVNGEQTVLGQRFVPSDSPNPSDPYGISKSEAEEGLRRIAEKMGIEVVIIRPVMVYGPGVKANFLEMMHWLSCGVPLPLGGVTENRRSLVFLDNLVDLIVTCIDHPSAANQTFLVSDDEDMSTTALLRQTAAALGKPARLIPVPVRLITLGAKMIGRPDIAQRLCSSLHVDISKTKALLGWSPSVSVDEGLRRTAEYWLRNETTV